MSFSFSDLMLSILYILYHSDEPISRYRIAKELNVSKQSVSYNVRKLIDSGLIESTPEGIRLPDFFHNPEIRKLFDEVSERLSDYMVFEQAVGDSHDMEMALRNTFTIMVLLSKPDLFNRGS